MKRQAFRGMTMVEVAITVAIVGGITAMGVSTFNSLQNNGQTNGEAQKLMSMMRNARTLSIVTGVRHGVYVGGASGSTPTAGTPDFRNRLISFRKKAIGSNSTQFLPGTDIVLSQRELPHLAGDSTAASMQFSLASHSTGNHFYVLYDEDGRPSLNLVSGGENTPVPFVNGCVRLRMAKPSTRTQDANLTANTFANPTERCMELSDSGEVKIIPKEDCALAGQCTGSKNRTVKPP